jgi:hypothetical protein
MPPSLTSLFASEWQKRHAGLDEKQVRATLKAASSPPYPSLCRPLLSRQARISQALSLGIGAFAAYSAWKESRSEDECEECREEARKTARKASPAVQRVRIGAGN